MIAFAVLHVLSASTTFQIREPADPGEGGIARTDEVQVADGDLPARSTRGARQSTWQELVVE